MIDSRAVLWYHVYSNATARAVFFIAKTSYLCYYTIWPRSNKAASAVASERKNVVNRGQTFLNAKTATAYGWSPYGSCFRKVAIMIAGICVIITQVDFQRKRFLKIREQSGGAAQLAAGWSTVPVSGQSGDTSAGDTPRYRPVVSSLAAPVSFGAATSLSGGVG